MRHMKVLMFTLLLTVFPVTSCIGGGLICSPFPECIPPIQLQLG